MASSGKKRGRPRFLTDWDRKQLRRERDRLNARAKVYLGDQFGRWMRLKLELDETHPGLAKVLLDCYDYRLAAAEDSDTESAQSTDSSDLKRKVSTSSRQLHNPCPIPTRSPVEDFDMSPAFCENTDSINVSQEIKEHRVLLQEVKEEPCPSQRSNQISAVKNTSFVNPFEVSISVMEESSGDNDSDDEYEPSSRVILKPSKMSDLEEMTFEEKEFGEEESDTDKMESETRDMNKDPGPGVTQIVHPEDINLLTEDRTCLVNESCLLKLASTNVSKICNVEGCNSSVTIQTENTGSALYIYWECEQKHEVYRWCSQPVLNKNLHSGDLQIASALLCSGNNFSKMDLFAKFLKLYFPSKVTFSNIQRKYLVPTIDSFWMENQSQVVESIKGENVVALVNCHNDSPGHDAQCCCTMMDEQSKKIMSLVTMDSKEITDRSNVEKACFQKAMSDLLEKDVNIEEVVTDSHKQIGAVMKNVFPSIKHSQDVWHAAKNLGEKLIKASQPKECRAVLDWSSYTVNHFWHCCSSATDLDNFLEIWCGIVHHVVNEHKWEISYSSNEFGVRQCMHWPIREKHTKWMEKDSPAHKALIQVVLNKTFLKAIPYYINFRSTAELENMKNLILMYSGEGYTYSPLVSQARSQLAALDYNVNVDRDVKRNSDGTVQQHRMFNDKSCRWHVSPVKVGKSYQHVHLLMERIIAARLKDERDT